MKISIVTISFNQVDFLKECIESIINQPDYIELIVVDPGSTDGSRELIDSYGDRIVKVYERDEGPSDGLNKGFQKATGDIFGFINSDDALAPDASKIILKEFKDNKVGAICGTGSFINETGQDIGKAAGSKFSALLYAIGAVTVFQQSTFFRKSAFDKVGGFNKNNKTCWDSELFFDMARNGIKFKPVWGKIGLFRLHSQSISGSNKFETQNKIDTNRIKSVYLDSNLGFFYRFLSKFNYFIKLIIDPTYYFRKGTIRSTSVRNIMK